jgi:Pretoxin HINT domain
VQTIVSNTIHPYFVQLPEGATAPPSSERHVYDGKIARGAWVDASNLKAGYRLLNDDGSWAEVTGITVEQAPLKAYNLTIEGYHTFFVSGNAEANPVWVHNNNCIQFSAQANAAARRLGINASDITVNNGVANISIIQTRNLRFSDFDTLRSDLRANGASSVNINTGVVKNQRINDLLSRAVQQGTSFRGLNVFRTGPDTFILTGRI